MSSDVSGARSATGRLFHTAGPLTRNSDRRSMSSFVELAAAAGWRTGDWNGRRSVTSADSMPQGMMVLDRGYTICQQNCLISDPFPE